MLFFVEVLAPHSGKLEGHAIDHVLCRDLGLEPEPSVDVIATFLLFIKPKSNKPIKIIQTIILTYKGEGSS